MEGIRLDLTIIILAFFFLGGCTKEEDAYPKSTGVLINGVIWAKSNLDKTGIFATKPEEYGMFYQWNRKMAWSNISEISDWDISDEQGDVWTNENDPCPKGWRVPTNTEFETLANENKVSYEWMDNRQGALFTDKITGASIFFPASGLRQSLVTNVGNLGFYWSSSATDGNGYYMSITNYRFYPNYYGSRSYGFSVRCVLDR